jgi:hypothetical protein
MTSEVYVAKMPFEDVFISFKGINDNEIELTVQVIPLMQVLWSGMWLFSIGIIIRLAVGYLPGRKAKGIYEPEPERRRGRRPVRKPVRSTVRSARPKKRTMESKDDDEYEKMLEEELKNL